MRKGKKKDKRPLKLNKEKIKVMGSGLENMTYKDMKRRAVSLGMPFPDACSADYNRLASYIHHSNNKPDNSLIDEYDKWMDNQLELAGYDKDDPMRSYQLNLGFISEDTVTKQKKTKRIKGLEKPKKPKKEKDDNGLWKGTKKSYVFELTYKGLPIDRIIRRVQKKFPDAKEKSIQQWYRTALRKQKKE